MFGTSPFTRPRRSKSSIHIQSRRVSPFRSPRSPLRTRRRLCDSSSTCSSGARRAHDLAGRAHSESGAIANKSQWRRCLTSGLTSIRSDRSAGDNRSTVRVRPLPSRAAPNGRTEYALHPRRGRPHVPDCASPRTAAAPCGRASRSTDHLVALANSRASAGRDSASVPCSTMWKWAPPKIRARGGCLSVWWRRQVPRWLVSCSRADCFWLRPPSASLFSFGWSTGAKRVLKRKAVAIAASHARAAKGRLNPRHLLEPRAGHNCGEVGGPRPSEIR